MWRLIACSDNPNRWLRLATTSDARGLWAGWAHGSAFLPAAPATGARRHLPEAQQGIGLRAPSSARVLSVEVAAGEQVQAGQRLILLEAMKMEFAIVAPSAGEIREVRAHVGEIVAQGTLLLSLL